MPSQPALHQCPVCQRSFDSSRGLSVHRDKVKACSWYAQDPAVFGAFLDEKGEIVLEDAAALPIDLEHTSPAPVAAEDDNTLDDDDYIPALFAELATQPQPATTFRPTTGMSCPLSRMLGAQARSLDDVDTPLVVVEHKEAAHIVRTDNSLKTQWRRIFESNTSIRDIVMEGTTDLNIGNLPSEAYAPFTSELDWRIAQWGVKEEVGQNALNRLLEIPGVRMPLMSLVL